MVIPLGLHNCTKHHWTESAMPPLYPMSLQYSYLSSTLVHCIHSVGHILIVSVDMFHTCSRFRWSFLFEPFSSPLSPSSSSSPPSPPLSQPLTFQPPRRLQSMWRRGMKYNPHSGGHDVDADGVQGWPERVWRQLLMRLAPFFSLSQRSRCSKAKTNTKVLHRKDKNKDLDHACSLILLQQTTMLAASSIGFFHQLCGFSILLRLIQHSIIVLQLYLQNSWKIHWLNKSVAPHGLSTLQICRESWCKW